MENLSLHPAVSLLSEELSRTRRRLHQIPEIGFSLPLTSRFVADYLERLGLEVETEVGVSGVVGTKRGEGPTLLFRADMDALPIQEPNSCEFKSQHEGSMHACGHDAHTAMLLIAAKILSQREIKGTIKFVFQPAEEAGTGAQRMIDDGVMTGVDEVYGLHVFPALPMGDYCISKRYSSSYSDKFKIEVLGKAGHVSAPHLTVDPVPIAANIVMSAHNIISRNVDPQEKAVISIPYIHGGEAFNATPDKVELQGVTRSFDPNIKALLEKRLQEVCDGVALSYGCSVNFEYTSCVFPVKNSEPCIGYALKAFKQVSLGTRHNFEPFIGEDFACFAALKPGCFVLVGCGTPGNNADLHSPAFRLDEDSLAIGASWWVRLAETRLNN